MHPHEPQHPCVSTRTPPRTQDRKSKHLKTWLVTQNRASPPSRASTSGAAARGSPNVRRAGEAGQASEPRRPARTISGHRESLQLCSELRGVMHSVIQKRQAASGSLPKASKVREKVPGLARAGAPSGEPATAADASIKDTSIREISLIHLRGRPAVRSPARASQGRTPGNGRRRHYTNGLVAHPGGQPHCMGTECMGNGIKACQRRQSKPNKP